MGRTPNTTKTVTFTVSTTPVVRACLEALVERGLYGKNVAEAAERIISHRLQELEGTAGYATLFSEVRDRLSTASKESTY
jgi:hypothetical protein